MCVTFGGSQPDRKTLKKQPAFAVMQLPTQVRQLIHFVAVASMFCKKAPIPPVFGVQR